MSFLGCVQKRPVLECITLNAYELHIPALSPEEGIMYMSLCIAYLTYSNKQPVEATKLRAREPVFSHTYGKPNALKVGRNSATLQSSRRTDLSMDRATRPRYRMNNELISQAWRWSIKEPPYKA